MCNMGWFYDWWSRRAASGLMDEAQFREQYLGEYPLSESAKDEQFRGFRERVEEAALWPEYYPVIREKRDPKGYRGPRPAPGQTVALCPTCNKFTLFAFTKEETVRCVECSFEVSREDI